MYKQIREKFFHSIKRKSAIFKKNPFRRHSLETTLMIYKAFHDQQIYYQKIHIVHQGYLSHSSFSTRLIVDNTEFHAFKQNFKKQHLCPAFVDQLFKHFAFLVQRTLFKIQFSPQVYFCLQITCDFYDQISDQFNTI